MSVTPARRFASLALGLVAVASGCVAGAPAGEAIHSRVIVRENSITGELFAAWVGEDDVALVEARWLPTAQRGTGGHFRLGRYRVHARPWRGDGQAVEREP